MPIFSGWSWFATTLNNSAIAAHSTRIEGAFTTYVTCTRTSGEFLFIFLSFITYISNFVFTLRNIYISYHYCCILLSYILNYILISGSTFFPTTKSTLFNTRSIYFCYIDLVHMSECEYELSWPWNFWSI